jgi:hypothetical protein
MVWALTLAALAVSFACANVDRPDINAKPDSADNSME